MSTTAAPRPPRRLATHPSDDARTAEPPIGLVERSRHVLAATGLTVLLGGYALVRGGVLLAIDWVSDRRPASGLPTVERGPGPRTHAGVPEEGSRGTTLEP